MAYRQSIAFSFTAVLAALMVLFCVSPAPAAPEGTMTIGVHVTLVSRWLDPAETEGLSDEKGPSASLALSTAR